MNILVMCDDRWHPARTVRAGLAPLENTGLHFDWIEDAHDWSVERMAAYPVMILSKSNNVSSTDDSKWVSAEVEQAIVAYVRQGHGLLAIHSGTAGYQETPALRALLGGVFDHHPEQCPVTVAPVGEHPLSAGLPAFTAKDEHYFMTMDARDAQVFLTATSQHGEQPAGWLRQESAGRVAVLTPGHNVEVWLEPTFQSLLQTTLQWCAQKA